MNLVRLLRKKYAGFLKSKWNLYIKDHTVKKNVEDSFNTSIGEINDYIERLIETIKKRVYRKVKYEN